MTDKRVKFRLQVGDLVFTGTADGSNTRENWRYKRPTSAEFTQECHRLTLTLDLGGDVQVKVRREKGGKVSQHGRRAIKTRNGGKSG